MKQHDKILMHYGILGMRWGVRRDNPGGGRSSGSSKPGFKSDAEWENHVYSSKTYKSVYNKAAETMNKEHLGKINKKWEGKDLSKDENFKPYMKELATTFQRVGNQELSKQLGGNTTNPSGTQRVGFVFSDITGFGAIVPEDVKHADDLSNLGLRLVFDPKTKFVIKVEFFDDGMTQSAIDGKNALEHYGILGMKWGVRRGRNASSEATTVAALRKKKSYELTNEELKKVSQRLRLEQEYNTLNKSGLTKAREAVTKTIGDSTKEVVKEVAKNKLKNIKLEDVTSATVKASQIGQSVMDQAMHIYLAAKH